MSSRSLMCDYSQLSKWVKNYQEAQAEDVITKSGIIRLPALKNYIAELEQKYKDEDLEVTGFRFYLIRYSADEVDHMKEHYKFTKDNKYTQVSMVLVPTYNYKDEFKENKHELSADDCITKEDKIFVLPFGHPDHIGEGTGLCPPNCKGSIGGSTTISGGSTSGTGTGG